jgi:hypothetical protein
VLVEFAKATVHLIREAQMISDRTAGVLIYARIKLSIYAALLGVARVRVAPPRDGLAQRDVGDELLARQPRVGARVRLLGAQPGRNGLPLVGLPGAGGDLHERGAASSKPHRAPSYNRERC